MACARKSVHTEAFPAKLRSGFALENATK
ncbi:predicted protein [Brucella sp. 83/13]|nr:predicted protein [Brucella sp. 83/13]